MSKSREELIADTREDAVAVFEDFRHLKAIVEQTETEPVDLRHASAVARRWLVEEVLKRVANPRVGKLEIKAIDNNPVYRAVRKGGIQVFVSGGAAIHGVYVAAGMLNAGNRAQNLSDYHPDTLIDLNLDSFLKQKVIFTEGTWLTRRQVVKFVANVDHGVHGGVAKERSDELLSNFRHQISVTLGHWPNGEKIPSITMEVGPKANPKVLTKYDPNRVNGVLLELLATIGFLVSSPDVMQLIEIIEKELESA